MIRENRDTKRHKTNSYCLQTEVVEGSPGRCLVEFRVQPVHVNLRGTMHGGMGATLVDQISTIALIGDDPESVGKLGVSTDMSIR